MSNPEKKILETELRQWLVRLESLQKKIGETNGYTESVQKLRILTEFVREQLPNENTNHSNSETR